MSITGKTRLLGVIGDPIGHSLSPLMHNAAIRALGVDYVYLPFPIRAEKLGDAMAGFGAIDLRGFSVTIPHKIAILDYLSEVTEKARLVGAVNTVRHVDGGWWGTNTDVDGFLAPLKVLDRDWNRVNPVILGNGGAARAVAVACHELGCREIRVLGRDRDKLDRFKQNWFGTGVYEALEVLTWDKLEGMVSSTELLINTTPIGMSPRSDVSPIDGDLLKLLPSGAIVYDLIYTPRPTEFLKLAGKAGYRTIDGLEMLVQQGAIALKMWLDRDVPVEVMRNALLDHLR